MPRYFLEVSYKGTNYSGFQSQQNANTIQAEIEKAFAILQKEKIIMTGSSRTDAGVHAMQNFFHFDTNSPLSRQLAGWRGVGGEADFTYKMNAILPDDIVVKKLIPIAEEAHCRFDAISREYRYYIYRNKAPFLKDRAYYFPYKLNVDLMRSAAAIIKEYDDFTSFSKRNTQVKSFHCEIQESDWLQEKDCLIYHVKANRFLRGMVRALTATMLKIGREKLSIDQFREIIKLKDCTKSSFAVPAKGLFLISVIFPPNLLANKF